MARLVFDTEFLDSWAQVRTKRESDRIDAMLELIAEFPGVGSAIKAHSVDVAYGPNVLKALAGPYQIIYEYDRKGDVVYVYGLLYGPSVV